MDAAEHRIIAAAFYRTAAGKEPVRAGLLAMDDEVRRIIGTDIRTGEFGWPVGMPVCRPIGVGLFEVRSSITHGRMARVLFCIHEGKMVLLHGLIKKSQKTPSVELETTIKRKRETEQ